MLTGKIWLAFFVVPYLIGFSALALVRGSIEFLIYAAVMVVLIGLVLLADRKVRFSRLVLWGLAIWGFLHMAGGTVPIGEVDAEGDPLVLYAYRPAAWFIKYDQFVHAFGFAFATLASWEAIRSAVHPPIALRMSAGVALGVGLMGMGLGALNEVVEFTATRLLPKTGVGGYENTGWDLVSNMSGAAAAACWLVANATNRAASHRHSPCGPSDE